MRSSAEIVCVAPDMSEGSVPLTVSNAGQTSGGVHPYSFETVEYRNLQQPEVYSMSASITSIMGGMELVVVGANFGDIDYGATCIIGSVQVRASLWNSTHLSCLVPAHSVGNKTVAVSLNQDTLMSTHSQLVEYTKFSNLTSVTPSYALANGGTVLTIQNVDWTNSMKFGLHCRFNVGQTPLLFNSASEIAQCVSPPQEAGYHALGVSNTYVRQASSFESSLEVVIDRPSVIHSVYPLNGFSTGGTSLTVAGVNFVSSVTLICRFGSSVEVAAIFVSSEELICSTPPNVPGPTAVHIINHGINYTPDTQAAVFFTYIRDVHILRTEPAVINQYGCSTESVITQGLQDGDHVCCVFGSVHFSAQSALNGII